MSPAHENLMRCSLTLHAAQKRIDWTHHGRQSKVWLDMKSCDMCPTGRKLYFGVLLRNDDLPLPLAAMPWGHLPVLQKAGATPLREQNLTMETALCKARKNLKVFAFCTTRTAVAVAGGLPSYDAPPQ